MPRATWRSADPVLPDAAGRHYRAQQRRTLATLLMTRRSWGQMTPDLDSGWRSVRSRLTLLVGASQLGAARDAADYVPTALKEMGEPDEPAGQVVPEAFAGVAGDGRDLESLLYGAVTKTKTKLGQGAEMEQALASGQTWLDMAVQTALADADRLATQAAIVARPRVQGYVRVINLPACDRCVILAGRWYAYDADFERHPQCDCRIAPSSREGATTSDPLEAVRAGQVTNLSLADERAILSGADPVAVINAKRGMGTAGGVKVTRSGRAGGRRGPRLRPEGIYALASDRADAIRLLRVHGYLT